MKIAFIVQRYGTEILGGSEYHCRLIAERLATKHEVEVLTTCARDYVTWKNEYPEGADRVRGVTVRRFAVAETRDIASFNQFSDWIFNNPHTADQEMEWLRRQGPWSPALLEYLKRHHQQYDALIFFTYLYAPTVLGLRVAPGRSILVPTAHDEPAIHLDLYKEVFTLPAAIAYNTEVERRFLETHFSIRAVAEETVGCGVDLPHGRSGAAQPTRTPAPIDELDHRRRQRRRPAAAAAHLGARRDVPAAAPAARRLRPLWGPHRPGQGLRGADRVLQLLRARRRRCVARADGRQADAVAGGALGAVCRPALGTRTSGGARRGDRCRRAVSVREPVAAGARGLRRRHADPGQRPVAKCSSITASGATRACSTQTATSSSKPCGCC